MKKYLAYILILILAAGIFGPVAKMSAADGTCVYSVGDAYNKKGDPAKLTDGTPLTQEQCGINSNMSWIPSGSTTPSSPLTAYQQCINKGGTYDSCKILSGAPATAPTTPQADPTGYCAPAGGVGPPRLTPKANCPPPNVWSATLTETTYQLLAPLPCDSSKDGSACVGNQFSSYDPTQNNNLAPYLNLMIRIFIGICAVLAVIMIVVGGIEYMTSELISSKESGKEKITHAIFGLLLALGAWTLLNQINPDLLKADLSSLKTAVVTVDLGGEGTTPLNESTIQNQLQGTGINCPKSGGSGAVSSIAQSYIGHSTYSQTARNTVSGTTANVDCSSYVSQVYVCAGLSNPGGTTAGIFGSATRVTNVSTDGTTVNGTALKVGDLIGWKQGENNETWGHVMMYVGNGQMIDAQGQGGVAIRPVSSYAARIKYIKPI